MKVTFLWVDKTKDEHIASLIAGYLRALKRYVEIELIETRPAKDRNPQEAMKREGREILKHLARGGVRLGLDPAGRMYTSSVFARNFKAWMDRGGARIAFVVGGEEGLWPDLIERLDGTVSLSRMTLTHEMARLVLVEQVFRALAILKGTGYHR